MYSKGRLILNMMSLHRKLATRAVQISVRNIQTSSALRKSFYEVLGLPRDATQADIKNAYFELSKIYHPDRIAATDENLTRFREISDAYEVLGNEQSRKLYDRGLMGDFKRPGMDSSEEITDPVVKFYKKRQDMIKPKSGEELDAWAKSYYKGARAKRTQEYQHYTVKKDYFEKEGWLVDPFWVGSLMLLSGLLLTNCKETKAYRIWNTVFGTDSSLKK